jgi:F0F1-type ATP synthase delta subunit
MNLLEKQALALYEAIAEQPKQYKKIMERFVSYLKKDESDFDPKEFLEIFGKLVKKKELEKKVVVTVVDASKVGASFKEEVVASLPNGYSYEVQVLEDKSLVGGMVVRIDDLLIDRSYRKSLEKLYSRMTL